MKAVTCPGGISVLGSDFNYEIILHFSLEKFPPERRRSLFVNGKETRLSELADANNRVINMVLGTQPGTQDTNQ